MEYQCQGTPFHFQLLQQPQHLFHLLWLFPNSSHGPQVHSTPLLLIPQPLQPPPYSTLNPSPTLLHRATYRQAPHGIHGNSWELKGPYKDLMEQTQRLPMVAYSHLWSWTLCPRNSTDQTWSQIHQNPFCLTFTYHFILCFHHVSYSNSVPHIHIV